MTIECCTCKKNLGEKAPYNNHETTHGICKTCLNLWIKELEASLLIRNPEALQETEPPPKKDLEAWTISKPSQGVGVGPPAKSCQDKSGKCRETRLPCSCPNHTFQTA